MYEQTVDETAALADKKARFLHRNPIGYFLSSAMAGAYVGLGVVLIFVLGAPLAAAGAPVRQAVMSASFGVALSLVVFAGSELFTGNNLTMTCGVWRRSVRARELVAVWIVSWLGNLAGAVFLAAMVHGAGVAGHGAAFIATAAAAKMSAPPLTLFLRAVLCNWLVCLAIWTASRTTNDMAKLALIFWCLFAFVGSGYEHSVANMTLLTLALLQQAGPGVTVAGFAYNVGIVTAGNILGGAGMVAGLYCIASRAPAPRPKRARAAAPSLAEGPAVPSPASAVGSSHAS